MTKKSKNTDNVFSAVNVLNGSNQILVLNMNTYLLTQNTNALMLLQNFERNHKQEFSQRFIKVHSQLLMPYDRLRLRGLTFQVT